MEIVLFVAIVLLVYVLFIVARRARIMEEHLNIPDHVKNKDLAKYLADTEK